MYLQAGSRRGFKMAAAKALRHRMISGRMRTDALASRIMRRRSSSASTSGTTSSNMSSFDEIPILSLPSPSPSSSSSSSSITTQQEEEFASQLRHICHNIGFFYISNHNVRDQTYKNALDSSKQFFGLPIRSKMEIDYRNSPSFRGYMNLGCENTAGKPDQREQIEFGVEPASESTTTSTALPYYKRLIGPNQWPDEHVPTLRPHIRTFMSEMECLSRRLMEYLALSLGLSRNCFDDTFRDEPNIQLKICRYPPLLNNDVAEENVSFGVGAHTDSGYLSLLFQDDVGGLQIQNGSGDWIDAPPIDGTIVVNIGEMLQLVSGGYLMATPHRVLNTAASTGKGRYSLPYFWNPRLDFRAESLNLPDSLEWERPKPLLKSVTATDSHGKRGNKLHSCYGENAFKSLARSHPEVVQRQHQDLLSKSAF